MAGADEDSETSGKAAVSGSSPPDPSSRSLRIDRTGGMRGLVDDITNRMRLMILDHELPPGTELVQTEWAERLGVSRTPLREAFRVLEGDGLVRVSNGNRTVQVASYSGDELHDLYEVRGAVDGLAAGLLAKRGLGVAQETELNALIERMADASSPFRPAEWFSAHLEFHLYICQACGNSRVASLDMLIRSSCMSLHSAMVVSDPDDSAPLQRILRTADRQHTEIFEAIREGQVARAEFAARDHIETTLQSGLVEDASDHLAQKRSR